MARVLLTTMQVQSTTDELLQPLIRDGHELVLRRFSEGADEEGLIVALAGARASIAGVEPYTARVFDAARTCGSSPGPASATTRSTSRRRRRTALS